MGDDKIEDFQLPPKVQVSNSPVYITGKRLGKGGFGQVVLGTRSGKPRSGQKDPRPTEVALKFEHKTSKGCTASGAPYEWSVYSSLGEVYGVPKVHFKGQTGDFYVMVMDLLGSSLWDIWSKYGTPVHLTPQYVACVAIEAIAILQGLHSKGYVHGDVKPENLLLGQPNTPRANKLYLVDFGLTQRWRDSKGNHVRYDQRPDDFRGTIRYASMHAHLGRTPSRRDDLESLAYTLMFLLKGRLPWQGFQGDNKGYLVARKKTTTSADTLARGIDEPACRIFRTFVDAVLNLKFDEEPLYAAYIKLFEPIGSEPDRTPARTLQVDIAETLAKKRGRVELDTLNSDFGADGKRRKIRQGFPALQWITIYHKVKPMKQRYHYNVSQLRLNVHVSKGFEDGLAITSVCACGDLWAIIMDASDEYNEQTYHTSSRIFMPKEWIMAQWEEGYYITAAAGNNMGDSLIVMSKGTTFSQQSYKVSDSFPFEWIRKKWKEGFHVTSMATSKMTWAIIMSKCSAYIDQCVELDFQYGSEGIHRRWDEGYRITSCAATPDQAAFVLSLCRGNALEETQETLRTSTFPSEHVKDKWAKDLYIAGIAYGRTV